MNNSGFLETVAEKAPLGFARHFAFCELVQDRPLSIDVAEALLHFAGLEPMGIQLIGTFSEQTFNWVWSQSQFGGPACDLAEHLRAQASVPGYDLFGMPELPLSMAHPFAIGIACAGVAGEACFWCTPVESGFLLLIVLNPPVEALSFRAFSAAFAASAEYYPDRRQLLETMAEQLDLPLESRGDSLICRCGGEEFAVQSAPTVGLLTTAEIQEVERLLLEANECGQRRDFVGLRRCLESALALHSESYDAHRIMAGLEMAEGNLEDAELHYLICDQLQPRNAQPLAALAKIYEGRPSLARDARRRALEVAPDAFAFYFYGEELARAGQFLQAQQMMEEALPLSDNPGPPLEYLGRFAAILGRRQVAIAAFSRLLEGGAGDENLRAELERLRNLP